MRAISACINVSFLSKGALDIFDTFFCARHLPVYSAVSLPTQEMSSYNTIIKLQLNYLL